MKKILLKIPQILVLAGILTIIGVSEGKIFNKSLKKAELSPPTALQNTDTLAFLKEYYPGHKFEVSSATNSIIVKNQNGKFIAELLLTSPSCKQYTGFGGEVPFIIVLNHDKKIEKLIMLPNSETPGFFAELEKMGFFNSWNGLTTTEAINKKVDAVSGSTYTSSCVINSINTRLSLYTNLVQKKNELNTKALLKNSFVLLAIVFALLSFIFTSRFRKVRLLLLIVNIAVMGFVAGDFLSIAFFDRLIINGIDPIMRLAIVCVGLLSLILPFVTNKAFYCQYVCPYGSLQELAGKITVKKHKLPQRIASWFRYIPYVYLIALFAMVIAGVKITLEDFEPFTAFSYKFAAISTFVLAGVFVVLSVFFVKPWCSYFCPTGAFLDLFRKPLFFNQKKHDKK